MSKGTDTVVLGDVSGSMKHRMTKQRRELSARDDSEDDKMITRMQSTVNAVLKAFESRASFASNNDNGDRLAFLAFGLLPSENENHQHCDLLSLCESKVFSNLTRSDCVALLQQYGIFNNLDRYLKSSEVANKQVWRVYGQLPLIRICERSGALCCETFIKEHLEDYDECGRLFMHFHRHNHLLVKLIRGLPDCCKNPETYEEYKRKKEDDQAKYGLRGAAAVGIPAMIFASGPIGWGVSAAAFVLTGVGISTAVEKVYSKEEDKQVQEALKKAKQTVSSPIYDILRVEGKTALRSVGDVLALIDQLRKQYPLDVKLKPKPRNLQLQQVKSSGIYIDDKGNEFDVNKLITDIEDKIYGTTPLCQAIRNACGLFKMSINKQKILLIISDGYENPGTGDPAKEAQYLKYKYGDNIIIMSCFITESNKYDIDRPQQLYYEMDEKWCDGAKTMFKAATYISYRSRAVSILMKQGWVVPMEGELKLFAQSNHPKVIEQFTDLINHLSNDNDALVGLIGYCLFDGYLNNSIDEHCSKGMWQQESTCYANAVAMGLVLAKSRMYPQKDGSVLFKQNEEMPSFNVLKSEIIQTYGTDGYHAPTVLKQFCDKYGLGDKLKTLVRDKDVRQAICERRPLVAVFKGYAKQFEKFKQFFEKEPQGIMYQKDFQLSSEEIKDLKAKKVKKHGHAVILVRIEPKCLIFMNSWGTEWADHGLFRIETSKVLGMQYFDIQWEWNKLDEKDKEKLKQDYLKYCNDKASYAIKNYMPKELSNLDYKCPECQRKSKIFEYTGSFIKAKCPKCNQHFKPTTSELIKSLWDFQVVRQQ